MPLLSTATTFSIVTICSTGSSGTVSLLPALFAAAIFKCIFLKEVRAGVYRAFPQRTRTQKGSIRFSNQYEPAITYSFPVSRHKKRWVSGTAQILCPPGEGFGKVQKNSAGFLCWPWNETLQRSVSVRVCLPCWQPWERVVCVCVCGGGVSGYQTHNTAIGVVWRGGREGGLPLTGLLRSFWGWNLMGKLHVLRWFESLKVKMIANLKIQHHTTFFLSNPPTSIPNPVGEGVILRTFGSYTAPINNAIFSRPAMWFYFLMWEQAGNARPWSALTP